MKKTYADICLERAEKAYKGPWKLKTEGHDEQGCTWVEASGELCVFAYHWNENKDLSEVSKLDGWVSEYGTDELEFVAHARQDVPELARRLKIAITLLKNEDCAFDCKYEGRHPSCGFHDNVEELEKPLEGE